MDHETVFDLAIHPVHLGLGAAAVPQEAFTGELSWYQRYGERTARDGVEGRLVSMHTFTESWASWEVHPHGDELVVCLTGTMTLTQEIGGRTRSVALGPGQAVVNPPEAWHTADLEGTVDALFITAGAGTEHRPR